MTDANAPLTIGAAENAGFAKGSIDEVEIFHRALSTAEIQAIVNAGPSGKCRIATVQFSASNYQIAEDAGFVTVTVTRSGDLSAPITVDYSTSDGSTPPNFVACDTSSGIASSRCDFAPVFGTLKFASGESQKTFEVLINQDSYLEGSETFTLLLSNITDGPVLAEPSIATVTITNVVSLFGNVIDDTTAFVRQHYHDFLHRRPDPAGLAFWVNEIESCGANAQCREVKRINVSAAFFLSIEFQETGFLSYRAHQVAFATGEHLQFAVFLRDAQRIGRGVVVRSGSWEQQLEQNKRDYFDEFVVRRAFSDSYPQATSATQFVDKLNQNAGGVLSASERSALIADLGSGMKTRAQAVRAIAQHPTLAQTQFNRAFVLMQYFGYLRRNPNDLPDTDFAGYDFWLTKLNQFNGNYVAAEMIKAFISSSEYRRRFGPA